MKLSKAFLTAETQSSAEGAQRFDHSLCAPSAFFAPLRLNVASVSNA